MPNVSWSDKNQELSLEENELIYDGFEKNGYELPHGCLAGSCGACRIEIISGSENLKAPGSMEQNTIDSIKESNPDYKDKNIRLSCRTRVLASGDITFKILK